MQAQQSEVFGLEYEEQLDILTVKPWPIKSKRFPMGGDASLLVDNVFESLGNTRVSYNIRNIFAKTHLNKA